MSRWHFWGSWYPPFHRMANKYHLRHGFLFACNQASPGSVFWKQGSLLIALYSYKMTLCCHFNWCFCNCCANCLFLSVGGTPRSQGLGWSWDIPVSSHRAHGLWGEPTVMFSPPLLVSCHHYCISCHTGAAVTCLNCCVCWVLSVPSFSGPSFTFKLSYCTQGACLHRVLGIAKTAQTTHGQGVGGRTPWERRAFCGLLCLGLVTPAGLIRCLWPPGPHCALLG